MGRVYIEEAERASPHQYLYPAILFLDENRQPLATVHDENMKARNDRFSHFFYTEIRVPPKARYAVFHTLRDKIGQVHKSPMTFPDGAISTGTAVFFYPERKGLLWGRFGGFGEFVVIVKR